ncbi:hypothetical protein TNIN_117951 [Trichonephila inaurata madagascariensis]|uniref:Uncharacterized protein n=1 Tax=Trichonephila inaurata madagascariensis TaxID=2747483 RepID=A0A8X7CHC4_9ARAC|nr:hypothetical protein TNIN_117951 [Trichonephila inaurata madagascariensis]
MAVATLFHYRLGPEILKVQEGVCGYDERWIVFVVLLFFWNFSKDVELEEEKIGMINHDHFNLKVLEGKVISQD